MISWPQFMSVVVIALGASLPFLSLYLRRRPRYAAKNADAPPTTGRSVLLVFGCIVVLYGALVAWRYWEIIKALEDQIMLATGLLLIMAAGMFVRVCAQNYQKGQPLFAVSKSELVYPLLFSPIVFFSIWAIEKTPKPTMFWFYASFLNGYFWESIVSVAKPIQAGRND